MTINVFLDPTQLPNQSQDQTTFDNNMGNLIQTLPAFAQQVNDTAGQINSAVAGGAYALPYVFDSGTADADPGPGRLRLSSATQNAATALRLDVLAGGQDVSSILDQFDASTSDVKGSIRLVKVGDPSKWLTFNVMARTAPSGYRNLTVVNTGGSSASPFANGDGLLVFFQRNGDIGLGLSATVLLASVTTTVAVTSMDFLNIFTSQFDRYQIEFSNIRPTVASVLQMRLAVGGAALATGYSGIAGDGVQSSLAGGGQSGFTLAGSNIHVSYGACGTVDIRNANGPGVLKAYGARSVYMSDATNFYRIVGDGGNSFAGACTGFQLLFLSGQIVAGARVQVYGFKKDL